MSGLRVPQTAPSHIQTFFLDTHCDLLFTYPHKISSRILNFVPMIKRQRENLATSMVLLNKPLSKSYAPVEFECKTCKRKFSSFQALGGHRASHKKPKLNGEEELRSEAKTLSLLGSKPKMHECSICGQEFSLGQALGGHMRRHRAEGVSSINQVVAKVPVLKRSNSKRVMCLDLNLTPLENDLKLLFGNKAPQVDLTLF